MNLAGDLVFYHFKMEWATPVLFIQTLIIMEQVQLVYAEVMNGITFTMLEEPKVVIISDTGVFTITIEENSKKYDEEFYPVWRWEIILLPFE